MPKQISKGYLPKPLIILAHGETGMGKTSLPLRSKGQLGSVYLIDAEHQAHLSSGDAYDPFYADTVNNTTEAITHIKNCYGNAAYGKPNVLVIDTISVLKEDAEDAVDESKGAEGAFWTPADWQRAKRPIKRLALAIQQNTQNMDYVFLLCRSKPETEGSGKNMKYTGRNIPDVPRGFDYTPQIIVEIVGINSLVIKKTKPAVEKYIPHGVSMNFETFYERIVAVMNSGAERFAINPKWLPVIQNATRELETAAIRNFATVKTVFAKYLPEIVINDYLKPEFTSTAQVTANYDDAVLLLAERVNEMLSKAQEG